MENKQQMGRTTLRPHRPRKKTLCNLQCSVSAHIKILRSEQAFNETACNVGGLFTTLVKTMRSQNASQEATYNLR